MYLSARIDLAAADCVSILAEAGFSVLAKVWDTPRALDLAAYPADGNSLIVRCVAQAESSDYVALKTMIAEGDFDRAVLVYCDPSQPHLSDEIESWAIGDVDRLAALLAGEGASS